MLLSGIVSGAETVIENTIPYKSDGYHTENLVFKIIFSFLIISALAYFIIAVIKKHYYGKQLHQKTESKLGVLEIKRISPRLTLLRVEANGKEIYLAQTENDLVILDRVELDSHHEENNSNAII